MEENAGGCPESTGLGDSDPVFLLDRDRAPCRVPVPDCTPPGGARAPPAWAQCKESRSKVLRVLDELVWWFNETGREQYTPEVPVAEADTRCGRREAVLLEVLPTGQARGVGESHLTRT